MQNNDFCVKWENLETPVNEKKNDISASIRFLITFIMKPDTVVIFFGSHMKV